MMAKKRGKSYSLLYITYEMSGKGNTSDKRSCQIFSFFFKTESKHLKTSYGLKCLSLKKSSGTGSFSMVTGCPGELITGDNIARQRV